MQDFEKTREIEQYKYLLESITRQIEIMEQLPAVYNAATLKHHREVIKQHLQELGIKDF